MTVQHLNVTILLPARCVLTTLVAKSVTVASAKHLKQHEKVECCTPVEIGTDEVEAQHQYNLLGQDASKKNIISL